jgi:hypothetical protein
MMRSVTTEELGNLTHEELRNYVESLRKWAGEVKDCIYQERRSEDKIALQQQMPEELAPTQQEIESDLQRSLAFYQHQLDHIMAQFPLAADFVTPIEAEDSPGVTV